MTLNILTLISAGKVTAEGDVMGFIQNVSLEQSQAIADWLCVATGGPVVLQLMGFEGVQTLVQSPQGLAKSVLG